MTRERKESIIFHSIALAIVITLMTILCFKNSDGQYIDLAINIALSDSSSFYGILFMCVGEYPAYFIIPIAGAIFFYNADYFNNKVSQVSFRIFAAILAMGSWAFMTIACTKIHKFETSTLIGFAVFAALFYGAITLGVGALVPKEQMRKLFKFAVFALVFTAVTFVVVRIMKTLWCRMRFRDLLKEGNYDGFTPWYKLMFGRENANPDYDYTSFPSGHTSSATHIFVICLLPNYFKKLDKKWIRTLLYCFCIASTIIIGISRIVNNAHYLSDVIMGGTITYAVFYLTKYIFFKDKKYEFKQKELVQNETAKK